MVKYLCWLSSINNKHRIAEEGKIRVRVGQGTREFELNEKDR